MCRLGLIAALTIIAASFASLARSQETERPPVGGVTSPQGAMIFYHASARDGACGPNCSEWIAAEGVVEWDTFKRLLAFMARFGDRKVPVVLNDWGGNLNVATTLGKIIRDHGLDVTAGTTIVAECAGATEAACFALKRSGKPLDDADVKSAIDAGEKRLNGHGRLLVRSSGTEPVIRVMGEGDDKALVEEVVDGIVDALTDHAA